MVAQSSGVDICRLEVVSQRIHGQHGSHARHVAEVVLERAAREFGARGGFDGHDARAGSFAEVAAQEREADACEVRTAAEAADHHVGFVARHLHLHERLLADDGLVQQHVVQYAAQAVARVVGVLYGCLDRLGDRQPEVARAVGIVGQSAASRVGQRAGRGDHLGSPRVHQQLAVRFLLVADLDHEDFQVEAEVLAGQRDGRTPLSAARFGRQVLDALFGVVVGLRQGRVGLVRAGGRDAFVLEIDLRRRVERPFQRIGPHERRTAPDAVEVAHLVGDVDEAFGRELLPYEFFGEDAVHLFGRHGTAGAGIERRQRFLRHVGHDVVPLDGDHLIGQQDFFRFHD